MKRLIIGMALIVPAMPLLAQDLITDGSHCVGIDCVPGEAFGFDTIRLKENNLRIKFDDTSNSGSFPSNDWQILVNDTSNGGLSRYSIQDVTSGRIPLTIEAGASNNALYIDNSGLMGLGTSNPVVEAHMVDGNTPTLRLEQDGSDGFTPQTWDIAGNEANFFIRDVSNGSALPLRIKPGAPDDALVIAANGFAGMGHESPDAPMHVLRTDAQQNFIQLESNAAGGAQDRAMMLLENNGGIRFEFANNSLGTQWRFQAATGSEDEFQVTKVGTGKIEMAVDAAGNLEIGGTLNEGSDRNSKQDIEHLPGDTVLERLLTVPVSEWSYKSAPERRHFGPMAQDFYAAFGLGADDRHISARDMAGVNMAAIQTLEARNRSLDDENRELRGELDEIRSQLLELQAVISEMRPGAAGQ
jgi:hypothetical protein